MEPLFLTLDEVIEIHQQQVDLYGGSHGVRDLGALESAVATPQATFGGDFLHRSIPAMAAAYLFHVCQNHPFVDGNKRTGANAALTFLWIQDWEPLFEEEELVHLVLAVASGVMDKGTLTGTFAARCRPLALGD
jgi:death-on-curing protein